MSSSSSSLSLLDGSQSGYESDSENEDLDSMRTSTSDVSTDTRLDADGESAQVSAEAHALQLAALRAALLSAPTSFDSHLRLVTALRSTDLHSEVGTLCVSYACS
jgi:hypothetical protein